MCVSFNMQMEKEIKELKSQRDLAQSRLQNLLETVGDQVKHSVNFLRRSSSSCFFTDTFTLVMHVGLREAFSPQSSVNWNIPRHQQG